MPDARVSILIEAKDHANVALERMRGNLRDVASEARPAGLLCAGLATGLALATSLARLLPIQATAIPPQQ